MGLDRLTPLDGSFLRVETPTAHMHVGWKGVFAPRAGEPLTLGELRQSISSRLCHAKRFRQRLAFPPAGLGEPMWVDDEYFSIERHVFGLTDAHEVLSGERFDQLCDDWLSRPLERDRALWRIAFAPTLDDGSVGLLMQVHHAMVDGKSAVELALLLLDGEAEAELGTEIVKWSPSPTPSQRSLALEALAHAGGESLRAVRATAGLARSPLRSLRIADTLRRTALAVSEDVLRPAPSSYVNVAIGERRRLVHYSAPIGKLLGARPAVAGSTLNDVALTVVAGALREVSMLTGRPPEPMKIMVPVSTRRIEETADLGNRISFVFIDLPVHRHRALDRLMTITAATSRFKDTGRASGGEAIMGALGVLPDPLRDAAARLAASPRMYNLTVSNVPGPRVPVFLRGCELLEAAPVIPLSDGHALSIGIFTYRDTVTFSVYSDPVALPESELLPAALNAAMLELDTLGRALPPGSDAVPTRGAAQTAVSELWSTA